MASSHNSFINFLLLFCILISPSIANTSSFLRRPKTLILPVTKVLDPYRNQHVTVINQRTPLVPIKFIIDIGLESFWVVCDHSYVSSTYKPAHCGSSQCSIASSNTRSAASEDCQHCLGGRGGSTLNTPGCNNNTCVIGSYNVGRQYFNGELFRDVVSVESADGRVVSTRNVMSICSQIEMLEGLASGVKGIAALGRTSLALPSQFAAAFQLDKKFAICLSSSTKSNGVVFFGKGPYVFRPKIDVSKSLNYTPLLLHPSLGKYDGNYFITVKSIKVNDKVVPFDSKLLSFKYFFTTGQGGTMFSTTSSYTVMNGTIHSALVHSFVEAMTMRHKDVPRVADVSPFKACFNSTYIAKTPVGPDVPTIDFVMKNNAVWRMFGANTMVQVAKDVTCLAFISDGGYYIASTIIIGGHQLEDNLLQFDIANNRLGFSSSLLSKQTSCSNFAS